MRTRARFQNFLMFAGDIFLLYVSLWLALLLRYLSQPNEEVWNIHLLPFTIIFSIWLITFYIGDLYSPLTLSNKIGILQRLFRLQAINGLISITVFYIFPIFIITPKTNLLLVLGISTIILFFWRLFTRSIVGGGWLKEKLAFTDINEETKELIKSFKNNPQFGYEIVGIFTNKPAEVKEMTVHKLNKLEDLINNNEVDAIVAHLSNDKQTSKLFSHIFKGVKFYDTAQFYETTTGKIPISIVKQAWFLQHISTQIKSPYDFMKRTIDIIAGLIGGIISLIFYPLIILAIKLDDGGPIFYRQRRVGQNNKIIEIKKFRTMKVDAEKNGPQFADENDPRVTRIGGWLRKTRLDELPQLWSLLKGDLSLVGPRPERPEFVAQFESQIQYYSTRHLIKPGLSGWAQINNIFGTSLEEAYKKLQYEIYYIKNRSFILDLAIILKTIKTILSQAGR
ncbi:sugar transferase [Candidatus Parcubacteria bacterium]|nr:MAG: sugar transferase [Candidatus Parcubacteria bacterium]